MVDTWEVVDEKDVPPRPTPKSTATVRTAMRDRLLTLEPGKYFKVPIPPAGPDGKDKAKGVRITIGRAASNAGIRIDSYEADGYIWVQRLPDEPVGEVVKEGRKK